MSTSRRHRAERAKALARSTVCVVCGQDGADTVYRVDESTAGPFSPKVRPVHAGCRAGIPEDRRRNSFPVSRDWFPTSRDW